MTCPTCRVVPLFFAWKLGQKIVVCCGHCGTVLRAEVES